jgi:hypothetical protein
MRRPSESPNGTLRMAPNAKLTQHCCVLLSMSSTQARVLVSFVETRSPRERGVVGVRAVPKETCGTRLHADRAPARWVAPATGAACGHPELGRPEGLGRT